MASYLEFPRSPPRIKRFGWRAVIGIPPSAVAISKRIPNFSMSCSICGNVEETNTHAVLECLLASQIWEGRTFDESLWTTKYWMLANCLDRPRRILDHNSFGDFLAVLWEYWNARNRFIFNRQEGNLHTLGKRAIDFVKSYCEVQESMSPLAAAKHATTWNLP